jgi:hypothetical protein
MSETIELQVEVPAELNDQLDAVAQALDRPRAWLWNRPSIVAAATVGILGLGQRRARCPPSYMTPSSPNAAISAAL